MSLSLRSVSVFLLLTEILMLAACTSSEPNEPQIDYAEVPMVELTKEFSITESEEYLPAQVSRVLVGDKGEIIISQSAEKSLHQFDAKGNYLGRIAGPGRGPGELSKYANAHYNGKTLVMSNNNGMFTVYKPNEQGFFEHETDHILRPPGYLVGLQSTDFRSFYVRADSARTPFGEIPPEFTVNFIHLVTIDHDSLVVKEKVFRLESHSSYVEITNNGNSMSYSALPYRYNENLSVLNDQSVLITRPKKSLIQFYDKNQTLVNELKLNIKPRPFTETDKEFHFKNIDRAELRDRMKMVSEFKPPFTGAFLDSQNRIWLSTDKSVNGSEYVIVDMEGNPIGRILIPIGGQLHAVRNGLLYVLMNTEDSTSINVYSVAI